MQKISKSRAMESHFYSMEFFFSFTRIFQNTFRNIPYNFFFVLFSYFQNNECKKISKFEREDKGNGIPLLHHSLLFSFTTIFPWTFKGKTMYNMCCMASESVPPTERAYHVNSVRHMERASRGASRALRERPWNNYVVRKMMGRSKGRSFEKLRYSYRALEKDINWCWNVEKIVCLLEIK